MVLYPHSTDRSVLPSDRDLLYWSVAFDGQRLFAACLTQCSNLAKAGDSIEIRETDDALTMSSERLGSYVVSAQRCFGNINTLGENPLGAIVVLGFATDSLASRSSCFVISAKARLPIGRPPYETPCTFVKSL